MTKWIAGAAVLAALLAAAVFYTRGSGDPAPAAATSPERTGESAAPAGLPLPTSRSKVDAAANPAPADPRLAALQVSPDNGLVEFVTAPDGKVIQEIDNDPHSLGYRKPTRDYLYAGDRVVGLTAYRYFGDRVEITRTAVSYKPDGSVDHLREATSYDFGKKQ